MFYDKIGESCSTTGTGTFTLGGATGTFRAWSQGPATGTDAFYYATNAAGSIWELGYGTYTTAASTLTRTLLASSTGSLINWATTPYYVYSVPVGAALKHMLAGLLNGVANVPGWLPAGAKWWDYTLGIATAWIKKTYVSGTRTTAGSHMDEGRAYLGLSGGAANIFVASPRHYWVDKGTTPPTFAADDVGKVFCLDITAATRAITLPANGTAGIGHGYRVGIYGYGSTTNSITLTPDASDAIDTGSAGATKSILGERLVWIEWDGAKSKWRTDYVAATTENFAYSADSAMATGSTAIPFDDTIPQNTEGVQLLSVSITPRSSTSKLEIEAEIFIGTGSVDAGTIALFQDSTANALAAKTDYTGATETRIVTLRHVMTSGTTSSTTFKIRYGTHSGITFTFNGRGGSRFMGGVANSIIRVREVP